MHRPDEYDVVIFENGTPAGMRDLATHGIIRSAERPTRRHYSQIASPLP